MILIFPSHKPIKTFLRHNYPTNINSSLRWMILVRCTLYMFSKLKSNNQILLINEPFKTCTVTDVFAISVSEQVYFPESEVCALPIKSLLFAPFVRMSVFTLKKK